MPKLLVTKSDISEENEKHIFSRLVAQRPTRVCQYHGESLIPRNGAIIGLILMPRDWLLGTRWRESVLMKLLEV